MSSRLKRTLFVMLLLLVAMPVALAKDGESKFATLNGAKAIGLGVPGGRAGQRGTGTNG